MKANQIKKLLKGMVDKLCESIGHEPIVKIIKERSYITGGCIPSMLAGEYVNDFDIYFFYKKDADEVLDYYKERFQDGDKFKVKLITENSINLTDKIQFIIKFYGEPPKVTEQFDWKHIKSWYVYPDVLSLEPEIYKYVMEKELIYTGSKYPLSSLLRIRKFIKKGWYVTTKTMLNIILDVVESFNNPHNGYVEKTTTDGSKYIVPDPTITDKEYEHKFDVAEVLYHLNGVDPLTIQQELMKRVRQNLTIKEIINLISE